MCTITAAIEATGGILNRLSMSSIDLDSKQQQIEQALVSVADLAACLLKACIDSNNTDCEGLPHPSVFVNSADYSMVNSQVYILCPPLEWSIVHIIKTILR